MVLLRLFFNFEFDQNFSRINDYEQEIEEGKMHRFTPVLCHTLDGWMGG